VTAVSDELLDPAAGAAVDGGAHLDPDAALFAALNAPRDGRMHDVVATIQAEQDRIIVAPLPDVLVVQGGPGTGKTVVALHRAAYLLYSHRDRLRSGVLVVGPGPRFVDYIGAVLPSLGEHGTALRTLGQLHDGVDARTTDAPPGPAPGRPLDAARAHRQLPAAAADQRPRRGRAPRRRRSRNPLPVGPRRARPAAPAPRARRGRRGAARGPPGAA
jgi:hypothetical protein